MKHNLRMLVMSMMMMVFMALTTSCAVTLASSGPTHHRTRHIWVGEVYYEQVYYVDGSHQTVVVSQKAVTNRKYNNGRHRGNGKY